MKRIIPSLALIVITVGVITFGATTAFFSDTETSKANVFAAGAIDLKVDNESYYNLNKCTEVTAGIWQWQGEADYPVPGTSCTTSWNLDDLDTGHLFFNFTDVKPDDEGEDTISFHVQNDAWACMDMTLTKNDDTSSNEPELGAGDVLENETNDWDGELAQNIEMFWWADDGDNVHEIGEPSISGGVKTLMDLASTSGAWSVALADATHNVWGTPGPIKADVTAYIAKAWCFGTLAPAPLADDADTGPLVRGTGVTCEGTTLGNMTQTDTATLDIQFRTEQARHNASFLCTKEEVRTGTLIVEKVVVGGQLAGTPEAFSFSYDGGSAVAFEEDGVNEIVVAAGLHTVVESPVTDYVASYENCTDVDVPNGGSATCTITNTFTPSTGTLTVVKVVDGGDAAADDFSFTVNGGAETPFDVDGTNVLVLASGDYDVVESTIVENYTPTYENSENENTNCTDLTVVAGQNVTCTITNTYVPPAPTTITIEKTVIGGTATTGSFTYRIDGNVAPLGSNVVTPGAHTVTETGGPTNYAATFGGSCNASGTITALLGQNVTCTITNTFTPPATTTIVTENFGTGDCLQDIPGWDEDPGESCPNGTVAAAIGTGDNTASPDGGRFALIGNNGYICRTINATGLENLQVSYYWRGDSDAEAGENGLVTFATGGTCANPTGTSTLATHPLTTLTWQSNTVNLPPSLNNTVFFARFFSGTNQGSESFRVDGLMYTGTSI